MATLLSMITSLPFGLLLAAAAVYLWFTMELASNIYHFSYGIYAVGLVLSWWFNRSRVFFITAVLALSQYALSGFPGVKFSHQADQALLHPIIAVLLPVNIFIFSLLKERGIFNVWGLTRFSMIGLQLIYFSLAFITGDSSLLGFFHQEPLRDSGSAVTALPNTAVAAYGIAFLLLLNRQVSSPAPLTNAFIAVLAATLAALCLTTGPAVTLFFSAAGIILIAAVIQDSYSMAYLDELTGLPARRALKEELLKLRGEYTIAMLDIDFFKKFNDTYGHDTGDDVLRLVASVLGKVSGGGKAFRYGGEEFTIVFPHTKLAEALPHLEELRAAVEKAPYAYRGKKSSKAKKPSTKKLFVTISIGAAERSEKHKQPAEVVKAADNALYRAKKKGRNCVSK